MATTNETKATTPARIVRPVVNLLKEDNTFLLRAEIPGVDGKDVDISVDRNILTIESKAAAYPSVDGKLIYGEFTPVRYRRSFTLSDDIDRDGIEAEYNNGVLTLRLPRAKNSFHKIQIKAS